MRLKRLHATLLGVSAAQSGSVEWARRRGGYSGCAVGDSAFVGLLAASTGGSRSQQGASSMPRSRSWRRPRSTSSVVMRVVVVPDFVGTRRHGLGLEEGLGKEERPTSSWLKTITAVDGPAMPFAEMADMTASTEKSLGVSRAKRLASDKNMRHYDLRRSPNLLTKEEEIQLGRSVQELLRWERVRSFLEMTFGRPPTLEEWARELAVLDGAEGMKRELTSLRDARDRMISCNLRLVLHIARKSFYSGGSGGLKSGLDDMIQDGTAGLVKAVERFDPEKGFRFSTYASWWVHQGIHMGLANAGRTIRLPMNMHTMVCRVMRMQSKLADQLGRDPTAHEIAMASGLHIDKVRHYLKVNKVEPYSLDARAWTKHSNDDDHSNYKVEDTLPTTQEQEPVVGADETLLRTNVETILGDLTDREAAVIRMRYGIGGRTPSTLESVGKRLSVTRERVRQIQVGALEKLRGTAPCHESLYSERSVKDEAIVGWEQHGLPPTMLLGLVEHAIEHPVPKKRGRPKGSTTRRDLGQGGAARRAGKKPPVAGANGTCAVSDRGRPQVSPPRKAWPSLQAA